METLGFDPFARRPQRRPCVRPGCRGQLVAEPLHGGRLHLVCTSIGCTVALIVERTSAPPGHRISDRFGDARTAADRKADAAAARPSCIAPIRQPLIGYAPCGHAASSGEHTLCPRHLHRWRECGEPELADWLAAGAPEPRDYFSDNGAGTDATDQTIEPDQGESARP